ncbi:LLM class flavin-dependent oxidoreductase, partial [Mycobacterium tuberculosis]
MDAARWPTGCGARPGSRGRPRGSGSRRAPVSRRRS